MTVALYQKGNEFVWEGLELAMKIVSEAEVEAHKALGWVLHPHETIEIPADAPAAPAATTAPVPDAPTADAATPAATPAAPAPATNPFAANPFA